MSDFFLDLKKFLEAGRKVVVARIISQKGSLPRTTGTKCMIFKDGSIHGTIGGGAMEFQVLKRAKEVIKDGRSSTLKFRLTGKEVAKTDMLCGGVADVFLEPIFPSNKIARDIFTRAATSVLKGYKAVLLTLISDGVGFENDTCRALVLDSGSGVEVCGSIAGENELNLTAFLEVDTPVIKTLGAKGHSIFVEPIQSGEILYIFGAGHVSTCVSPLAKTVGFQVVVIDDRGEFANKARFPEADEVLTLPFSESFNKLFINHCSYITIVTRGHTHDREVLRESLQQSPAYIGMIGSRRKRNLVYRSLIEEGFSEEKLKRVHSPIGLDIGAETPEEIAVSIVAELIKVRAQRQSKKPKEVNSR